MGGPPIHEDELRMRFIEKLCRNGFEIKCGKEFYLSHKDYSPDASGSTLRQMIDNARLNERIVEKLA